MDKCHKSGDKIFWESRTGTLHLPAPINTPAEQQKKHTESTEQILGFLRLSSSCSLGFFLFVIFVTESGGSFHGGRSPCLY